MKTAKNSKKSHEELREQYKELHQKVDEILWHDWDPIGVNKDEDVRDEYASYVPCIVKLKINESDVGEIANHLFHLESITMGVMGNIEHCRNIAQKILDI